MREKREGEREWERKRETQRHNTYKSRREQSTIVYPALQRAAEPARWPLLHFHFRRREQIAGAVAPFPFRHCRPACRPIYKYKYICFMWVCVYQCVHVYIYMYIHINIYIYTYIYIYIFMYIYIYIYIYICVCVYIYIR